MKSTRRSQTQRWDRSLSIARRGVELVCDLFNYHREPSGWFRTITYRSVEDDYVFQPLGVDILWCVAAATCACFLTVEVKADQNDSTGNFFFETVSNIEKNTRGAFVGSMAEWYLYTFPNTGRVYCLPLFDTRNWFLSREKEFTERAVESERDGRRWKTKGRLVPIERVMEEVPGARLFIKRGSRWLC